MDDLKGKITWYFGSEQKYPSSAIASKRGTAPNERVHIFSAAGVVVVEKMYYIWSLVIIIAARHIGAASGPTPQ